MNAHVQDKINEIKKLSAQSKNGRQVSPSTDNNSTDGLSTAIRTKKDADTFTAELKSIRKKAS